MARGDRPGYRLPPLRLCIIRGCDQPVPPHRTDAKLCDEHYAPVSDAVVNAWIARVLDLDFEFRNMREGSSARIARRFIGW